jgi:hypothetical protein
LAQIAKYYKSQRGFADVGYNNWPYSDYLIRVQQVQVGVSVAKVKSYIDKAIQNRTWLVLVFHDIKPSPDRGQWSYDYSTAHLDKIAQYVKAKGLPTANVADSLVSGNNLLPNGNFSAGLSSGWTTDDPSRVALDTRSRGNYPEPTNSIKMVSDDVTGKNVHLFSPKISVNPSSQYVIKSFLSVDRISAGVVAFFVDEYDANGNWVSGQYKTQEGSVFVENINFAYIPTSSNVAQASLQIIVTGNSGIVAYIDTVQWLLPQ